MHLSSCIICSHRQRQNKMKMILNTFNHVNTVMWYVHVRSGACVCIYVCVCVCVCVCVYVRALVWNQQENRLHYHALTPVTHIHTPSVSRFIPCESTAWGCECQTWWYTHPYNSESKWLPPSRAPHHFLRCLSLLSVLMGVCQQACLSLHVHLGTLIFIHGFI